jgi:hypothetical protein
VAAISTRNQKANLKAIASVMLTSTLMSSLRLRTKKSLTKPLLLVVVFALVVGCTTTVYAISLPQKIVHMPVNVTSVVHMPVYVTSVVVHYQISKVPGTCPSTVVFCSGGPPPPYEPDQTLSGYATGVGGVETIKVSVFSFGILDSNVTSVSIETSGFSILSTNSQIPFTMPTSGSGQSTLAVRLKSPTSNFNGQLSIMVDEFLG